MTQYLNYLKINALCNDVVVTIHAASSSPSPPLLPFLDSCELEIVILTFLEKDGQKDSQELKVLAPVA